jgi:hypothetical protein
MPPDRTGGLAANSSLIGPVMVHVLLARFRGVMRSMRAVTRSRVGMMSGCFVIIFLIVMGGFAMMARRFFMVVGSTVMMFTRGVLVRHVTSPFQRLAKMAEAA